MAPFNDFGPRFVAPIKETSDLKFGWEMLQKAALPILFFCVFFVLLTHVALGMPLVGVDLVAEMVGLFFILIFWGTIVYTMLCALIRLSDWLTED